MTRTAQTYRHDATRKIRDPGRAAAIRRVVGVNAVLWMTDETPADISGDKDRAEREIGVPPPTNGSILRVVDFPPVTGEIKGDNKPHWPRKWASAAR